MKHFLLIEPSENAKDTDKTLALSQEEFTTLPFSFLKGILSSPSDTQVDATPEDKPLPSLLLLSDSDTVIERGKSLGFATLRLPKREFPLVDTLAALPLEDYDTVVCCVSDAANADLSAIIPCRRLTISPHGEDAKTCTYAATFDITLDENATLDDLAKVFFAEEKEESETKTASTEPKMPLSHAIFEWIELFALSLAAVILIMTFFIRHSPVVGTSMVPTLHGGDVLLLTQVGFTPETGDIVIIQTDKDDFRRPLVKRVIATGGDTVRIDFESWQIFINGILLDEDYLDTTDKSEVMYLYSIQQYFEKVDELHAIYEAVVPEGHLFVLGDNRQNSKDSRDIGFVDERHVIGEVIYRILPLSAMGDPA